MKKVTNPDKLISIIVDFGESVIDLVKKGSFEKFLEKYLDE